MRKRIKSDAYRHRVPAGGRAAYLLTFARIGTMVMLLPGIGELSVPVRVRLTIALVLTAILLPLHEKAYTVNLQRSGRCWCCSARRCWSAPCWA